MKKKMQKPFSADLHMHTCHSTDSLSSLEQVLDAAVERGLSAIAITDHNEISGAIEAQKIAREMKLPLQVIVGEEVGCPEGDLLVYFLRKRIPKCTLAEALEEVRKQKAVCCMAHPYDTRRMGMMARGLPEGMLAGIDAIEAFNARSTGAHNAGAAGLAARLGKPALAGSDAHHASEAGAAFVEFSGVKKLDAKSLLSAKRKIRGRLSPQHVRFYSRYAVLRNRILASIK